MRGAVRALLARNNLTLWQIPIWVAGLALATLWFMPFLWMVSTSFKPSSDIMTPDIEWLPRTWTLENYRHVLGRYPVLRWVLNSTVVVTVSTAFSVLTGALAGYALARMRFRGGTVLFYLYLASLMVPLEAYVVPMLFAFAKAGLADTYAALILPSLGNVFAVIIFRQYFLTFPAELEEAARLDGAGAFRLFWQVALPLARAPLIASTVIIFTQNFNNFLWPLLITFSDSMKTLPVGMAALTPGTGSTTQLDSFGPAMAGVTLLSLPSVLCFLFLQRHFLTGLSGGGLKG